MRYDITIDDTGIPHGVRSISEQLPQIAQIKAGDEVRLHFTPGEFVYVTGLVLLAAWRKHLPQGVSVRVDDGACYDSAKKFLTNVGFREVIDTGHEFPSSQRRIGRVPLQPITNRFNKEATVADITSIFEEYAGQVHDTAPFKTLLSELCENVLAHSESTSPGYVCARVLEANLRAEIAIADTGIGIRESFIRGTNEVAKQRIAKGAGSIEIAVDGLNSSKPIAPSGTLRSYYGFGLLITRRLIEENRGLLTIISGNEMLMVDRFQRKQATLGRSWPGTFVGVVLDLGNPLPLEEIYEEAVDKVVPKPVAATSAPSTRTAAPPAAAASPAAPAGPAASAQVPKIIKSEKRVELRHYGSEMLTRDAGTAIRADLASYLAAGNCVVVSLEGVSDITPSVADEAFGKLAEIIGFDVFTEQVKFEGGPSVLRRLVEFVIKTRSRTLS
jgi:hypothetical protein